CSHRFRTAPLPQPAGAEPAGARLPEPAPLAPPPGGEVAIAKPEALPARQSNAVEDHAAPQPRRRYMDDGEDDEDRARVKVDRPLTGTVRSWVTITLLIAILGFAAIGILVSFLY